MIVVKVAKVENKWAIKRKIKFKDYKNCLKRTQFLYKITYPGKYNVNA